MNVQDYLEYRRRQKNAETMEEQKALLSRLGLYDVVYSPTGEQTEEFSEREVDARTGAVRFYKRVPAKATPEQYAEILKYEKPAGKAKLSLKDMFSSSIVGSVLFITGILLYVLGIILGCYMGTRTVTVSFFGDVQTKFYIGIALIYWVSGIVLGNLFIGIARIVQLLEKKK